MSSTQRVIWTACPNGVAGNGKLRVSVAIGPQLMTGSQARLSAFPDWLDWPAASIGWRVTIGSQTATATVVSAQPSSALYQALFRPTTPVDPYQYQSMSGASVYSHPASYLQDRFRGIYGGLAATLPKDGSWHSYQQLTGDNAFGVFPGNAELTQFWEREVQAAFPSGGGPIPYGKATQNPAFAAVLTALFLRPLAPASNTSPEPPKFDFHQAYSLLQRHPALLRRFGFVVDLEVPRPSGLPAAVALSVTPEWTPRLGAASTTDVSPITMTTSDTWLAAPRTGAIVGGLLPLSNPPSDPIHFEVVEMDVDGTVLKSLNFTRSIVGAVGRTADTPDSYGAPSLRSAGLSLSMPGYAAQQYANWTNNDVIDGQLPGPVTLNAEDIAQGYRIDVWDSRHARWYQLCARSGNPRGINGYGIGSPRHVVPVPAGDEGWIEPVTTQPPANPAVHQAPQLNLPETLLRWDGWSLVASRPGKHLSDTSADSLESDSGNPPPAAADFSVQIDYAATPGTLPALRFGRTYRFRARVVDLAGNSLPFDEGASFGEASSPVTYGRLEPVPSPVIVPCAPRTPGESLETLVIRSNYDIPDAKVASCERHLAPPVSSIQLAETHGVLDTAAGSPGKALYATLAGRDGLSYQSASVLKEFKGKTAGSWIYYPPDGSFGVPYLPDVLGCGVSLLGLPGAGTGPVVVPFGTGWPDKRAIRLVIEAGSGKPAPPPDGQADGPLVVRAPKASVTTVRLSSWFAPGQLGQLKLWQWLREAGEATTYLEKLFLAGGHYMVTPYRELTIVHAVRQPLTPPSVSQIQYSRDLGATYALLDVHASADPASTQRVDILSSYADPYDDGVSATGVVMLAHQARVGELPLETGSPGAISFPGMRDDFGDTKHHSVYYSLLATTRFLEYFTATADVALHGTTPAVVSKQGFAQGTVVVRGTGAHASVTYTSGTDFTEDDATGTIARVGSAQGRIGNGATVQVSYVAPPVTRSSLEKDAHPPTARGYLLQIPSSRRPAAPDVRYLIPAFSWQHSSSAAKLSSSRVGNTLRVYLGRPWFSSGAGEYLGVLVANPPPAGSTLPPDIAGYVSGYGHDPVFVTDTRRASQFALSDFTLAKVVGRSVVLEEQSGTQAWAGVAGHEVSWDAGRGLWFADIAMNLDPMYFPFVKLALCRYQPNSLTGIAVSRVVVADFIQVAPDRTMQLIFPSPTVVRVTVSGPGYLVESGAGTPDTIRAYVQQATVKTSDPGLVWTTVPSSAAGTVLGVVSQTEAETSWEGEVTLPSARGTAKYRILVAEFEQHDVVRLGNLESRVTYLDAIEI